MSLIPCPACQSKGEKEDPKRNQFTGKPCSVCLGRGKIENPVERVQKAMISFKLTRMFLAQIQQLFGMRFQMDKHLEHGVTEQDQSLLKMGIGIFSALSDDLEVCSGQLNSQDHPLDGIETMARIISVAASWLMNMAESTITRINIEPIIKKIDDGLEKVQTELQRADYVAIADCLEFEFGVTIKSLVEVLEEAQT